LLEFESQEKEAFMASFLIGPFESLEIAKKYEGDKEIKVERTDYAKRLHKTFREEFQTKSKLELLLKNNFIWHVIS
jgi:hypothetical protein